MPPLHRVLADHDLGLLRLMAELWGVTLAAGSQREAADELAAQMLAPDLAGEIIAALPPEPRAAFEQLARDGRQLLAGFTRRYGELRAMGAARRERERPWANAPSASEVLWYRGLIGRAFFDAGRGPEEFVFIPDDLRSLAYVAGASEAAARPPAPGHPAAAPVEGSPAVGPASGLNASGLNASGDDAVTLLAYLQVVAVRLESAPGAGAGVVPAAHRAALARFLRQPPALDFTLHLLRQLGLAQAADPGSKEPLRLAPEKVQAFLQGGGPERARRLAEAWRDSREWNDLLAVPGLAFEGSSWHNDPQAARRSLLQLLAQTPPGVWWSLDGFVAALKDRQPDFQRPAGDYDSWYIRDSRGGAFLRGFENWDRVDGALARWVIEQPLAWLGALDVAAESGGRPAFRITPYGAALLGLAGWPEAPEPAPLEVRPGGWVRALAGEGGAAINAAAKPAATAMANPAANAATNPAANAANPAVNPTANAATNADANPTNYAAASGYDRFQLARIADWLPPEPAAGAAATAGPHALVYPYRLTPASLARAARKGITSSRILTFLGRAAAGQADLPALAAAVRRWEQNGTEASLREAVVLRLAGPDLLATLRQTPGLGELLGEEIGPAAVEVKRADVERLRAALAEHGLLIEGN